MSRILFISDLHLCPERKETTRAFQHFLRHDACGAEALYILGDLFEYWLGDDTLAHHPFAQQIAHALAALASAGTKICLLVGNRDFLLGEQFCQQAGAQLLHGDNILTEHQQKRILLSHGDALCTDDSAYQAFRHQVRNPAWQQHFLALPLPERQKMAQQARAQSGEDKQDKAAAIMDTNADAVAALLREQHFPPLFIHGHTHRPAHHTHHLDGNICHRWVLADWDDGAAHFLTLQDGQISIGQPTSVPAS